MTYDEMIDEAISCFEENEVSDFLGRLKGGPMTTTTTGTMGGFNWEITRIDNGDRILYDSYGNDTYEFTDEAWWYLQDHHRMAQADDKLTEEEFVVMLSRSCIIFQLLKRVFINGYHHQRFYIERR